MVSCGAFRTAGWDQKREARGVGGEGMICNIGEHKGGAARGWGAGGVKEAVWLRELGRETGRGKGGNGCCRVQAAAASQPDDTLKLWQQIEMLAREAEAVVTLLESSMSVLPCHLLVGPVICHTAAGSQTLPGHQLGSGPNSGPALPDHTSTLQVLL